MKNTQPSDTYKKLYNYIIADLLLQICIKNHNYCVKYYIGKDILPIAIWKKFEEYECQASNKMSGSRLDRHKLASCICGAIIETRPLSGLNGFKIPKDANEILALYAGLGVIKAFMMDEVLEKISTDIKDEVRLYLKNNYELHFPSIDDNICDTQEYQKNLINALLWSHFNCTDSNKECYRYDIWAYSKIFYHLEMHNKSIFDKFLQDYLKTLPIN